MDDAEEIMGQYFNDKNVLTVFIVDFLVQKLIEITHKRDHPGFCSNLSSQSSIYSLEEGGVEYGIQEHTVVINPQKYVNCHSKHIFTYV